MTNKEFKPVDMPERDEAVRAIRRVAEAAHRLNATIEQAVKSGHTIELMRASRYHDGAGNWGDQILPIIREQKEDVPTPEED